MLKKLHYLLGIVLFLSLMPVRGMSQTDDGNTVKTPPAQHTHVVKKAWTGTKQAVSKGAHATAKASGKAWRGTKRAVSTGAHATAKATGKAWRGTKKAVSTGAHATVRTTGKAWRGTKKAVSKGYNNTIHPSAKTTDNAKVRQPEHVKPEDQPK